MKKILSVLLLVLFVGLAGCQSEREQDASAKKETKKEVTNTDDLSVTDVPKATPTPIPTDVSVFNYLIVNDRVVITGLKNDYPSQIAVPAEIEGLPVTEIGENAFLYCTRLTDVNLPEGVTKIGKNAFTGCTYLTVITLGDKVTHIGDYAFESCSSLTGMELPDSLTSIGDGAFKNCSGMTGITLPEGIMSVRYATFEGCSSLASITLPESLTSIGNSAFGRCSGLTSITLPKNLTSIGFITFYDCADELVFVVAKGSYAEMYAKEEGFRVENDTLEAVKETPEKCFKYQITNDEVSITGIDAYCPIHIIIPEKISGYPVTEISKSAFGFYDKLESIVIPDSVTSIGDRAFYECKSLTSIIIPNNVTSIGDYAFYKCNSMTSIIIPDSVTSIGDYAFYECNSMTSIIIPDSVTSIGTCAFRECDKLTSIIIPDGVTSIGYGTFYGCDSMTSIIIPDSVTSIEFNVFDDCADELVITVIKGSYAEKYAIEKKIDINVVEEGPTVVPEPTTTPKSTPEPTEVPKSTPKPTNTPKPTTKPTPKPTATPKPASNPTAIQKSFYEQENTYVYLGALKDSYWGDYTFEMKYPVFLGKGAEPLNKFVQSFVIDAESVKIPFGSDIYRGNRIIRITMEDEKRIGFEVYEEKYFPAGPGASASGTSYLLNKSDGSRVSIQTFLAEYGLTAEKVTDYMAEKHSKLSEWEKEYEYSGEQEWIEQEEEDRYKYLKQLFGTALQEDKNWGVSETGLYIYSGNLFSPVAGDGYGTMEITFEEISRLAGKTDKNGANAKPLETTQPLTYYKKVCEKVVLEDGERKYHSGSEYPVFEGTGSDVLNKFIQPKLYYRDGSGISALIEEWYMGYEMTEWEWIRITMEDKSRIGFHLETEDFLWGAHPIYDTESYLINKSDGSQVNIQAILTEYNLTIPKVVNYVVEQLAAYVGDHSEDYQEGYSGNPEDYFTSVLKNNHNWMLTEKGLCIYTQKDDLLIYACGPFKCEISFAELSKLANR